MLRSTDLPWFPVFTKDILSSGIVLRTPTEALGLIGLMMLRQWQDGPLPEEPDAVALVIARPPEEVRRHWDWIRLYFVQTQDGLANPRAEAERQKQESKHAAKVSAGRKGGRKRQAKAKQSPRNVLEAKAKQTSSNQNQKQTLYRESDGGAGFVSDDSEPPEASARA